MIQEQVRLLTKQQLAKVMELMCPLCRNELTMIGKKAYACVPCRTFYEIMPYRENL